MKVTLSPDLFQPPSEDLSLVALFEQVWRRRHRVELELEHPAISGWLAARDQSIREQCRQVVDESVHDETMAPSVISIAVVDQRVSDWTVDPPQLSLTDAKTLLDRPFEIYLEDNTSDRAFIRKMMTPEELDGVDELEENSRVRFVHGGGSNLKAQVARRAEEPSAPLQTWVLFDSDAMRPGAPSAPSGELSELCSSASIPFYRPSRRFIESYLPPAALERWGTARSVKRERNLPIARAFARLTPSQRYHFNMKKGFAGDEPRRHEAGDLYDGLDPGDQERLSRGFGERIGDLFQDTYPGGDREQTRYVYVSEQDLRRDGGWDELRPAIRQLLGHLGVS